MDEKTQILTILESARQSLSRMFADVTEEQARATPTASALCLGGILKHVTYGETIWVDFIVEGLRRTKIVGPYLTRESCDLCDRRRVSQQGVRFLSSR